MGFSKFVRTMKREYPMTTYGFIPSLLVTGVSAAVGLTIAPAAFVLMGIGGFFSLVTGVVSLDDDGAGSSNKQEVGGKYLVGEARDIYRVKRVQETIDNWTYKMKYAADIPLALRRKILAQASDAAESLSRRRVFEDSYSGKQAESFAFTRNHYDEKGIEVLQPIVVIDLKPHAALPAPEPVVIKALPAPQTLSLTFDDVKDRLERVELPRLTGPDKSGPDNGKRPVL